MKLEDQLSELAGLGLPLAADRTVEELLYSWPRESYEREPFQLVLFMLGSAVEGEPRELRFCDRAWSFDTRRVHGQGAYTEIARQLCRITGRSESLADLRDHVDIDAGEAWIEYTVGGRRRHWSIDVAGDRADLMVVDYLMDDLEHNGRRFYVRHNGQVMMLFFLDDAAASRLNAVADGQLIEAFLVQ
ncbi:hypothetical protein [Streptomyces sp. NPDC056661]|uniref:hypothetical protein n=1 Tax=Streptomyces sp. NPDC056661 TaxID=3345898 RepID=UPI00367B6251